MFPFNDQKVPQNVLLFPLGTCTVRTTSSRIQNGAMKLHAKSIFFSSDFTINLDLLLPPVCCSVHMPERGIHVAKKWKVVQEYGCATQSL